MKNIEAVRALLVTRNNGEYKGLSISVERWSEDKNIDLYEDIKLALAETNFETNETTYIDSEALGIEKLNFNKFMSVWG